MNGKTGYVMAGAALGLVNILIAAMVGFLLQDIKSLREELRDGINEIRQTNSEQDKISAAIRTEGFQRLSAVEAKAAEHERRLNALDRLR